MIRGGQGLASEPTQLEKALGAGPLPRTCAEGERHVKGGPLECGVPEFGGKALGEGVWMGFRPSTVGGGLRRGL